jgi:nucleoside permease NupC
MGRFTGILGLLSMVGLAFAFSTNRRAIKLKQSCGALDSTDIRFSGAEV